MGVLLFIYLFLFLSVIRERGDILCHPVIANYFQLKSIERKDKGNYQYQSLPGQVNLAIRSSDSVMSLIPTSGMGARICLRMRKPRAR